MGLIAARESMEGLRDPPEWDYEYNIVEVIHTFETPGDFEGGGNFTVDESTIEICINFKAKFAFDEFLPSDNTSRYVRATLANADGNITWSEDVSQDADPLEKCLEPNPRFAYGEWKLEINARGIGETTFNQVADLLIVRVTAKNTCMDYPLVDDCF